MKRTLEYPQCTITIYPYRGRLQIELRQPWMDDHVYVVDNAPTYGIAENTARRIARTISARAEGI